jgi:hypothetical protein
LVDGENGEEVKTEEISSNNNSSNVEEKKSKATYNRPPGYKLNRISHQDEIV